MVLRLGSEALFASKIPFLSRGSKQNRDECQLPFCKDRIPLLSLTHSVPKICLISFVKKQNNPPPKKKIKEKKTLGTLLRTRKEKPEEVEAFDVIVSPSVHLS